MVVGWLGAALACAGGDTTDSGESVGETAPAWTQVRVDCDSGDHRWSAYASGLHGHADLRLVPASAEGTSESHPMVVHEADPAGGWTLFRLDLAHEPGEASAVPGRLTPLDCRQEGLTWTWAVDLLVEDQVAACTAYVNDDTGPAPEQVATCGGPK